MSLSSGHGRARVQRPNHSDPSRMNTPTIVCHIAGLELLVGWRRSNFSAGSRLQRGPVPNEGVVCGIPTSLLPGNERHHGRSRTEAGRRAP
eukprot:556814-Pyramimonas_sp.AAC.1